MTIRTRSALALAALLLAADLDVALAAPPKPVKTVYRVTTFGKLRLTWTAGPAAIPCRVGGNGVVQVSLQYRTPTYVQVTKQGSRITLQPMNRSGRAAVGGPVAWFLEAGVAVSDLTPGIAGCEGAFDVTGCGRTDYRDANAGDPKLTVTRRTGPPNVFSLAVAGALFRPRTGGCYTAGYADFGKLGSPGGVKALTAALPPNMPSLARVSRKATGRGTYTLADEANAQVTWERSLEVIFDRVRTI